MTTLYQNNFDSDAVGALPAGWANKVGAWTVGTRNPVTASNTLGANSDGDVVLYTGLAARADMQVDTKQKMVAAGSAYPLIGHILRSDAANANNYTVVFSTGTTTGINVLLFKKVGGSYTQVSSQTISYAAAISASSVLQIRSRIVGSTISIYVGTSGSLPSTPSASFTDGSITAAGYPGLYYSVENTGAALAVDDFVYDDTLTAGAVVPGAPTLGVATAGNGNASFPYTAPSSDGGSAITSYVLSVYYASDNTLVGNVDPTLANPIVANGLINGQAVYGKLRAVNSVGPGPQSAASNTVTPNVATANNALASNTGAVLFSPANWDVQASTAKTINAGAYFKTIFGGTTCTLNFDLTGVTNPLPEISYRVDGFGPWITTNIAASIAVSIPADTADYASKPGHLLEVIVKSMTETQSRWSPQSTAVKLTGIILDAGKTLTAPPAKPLRGLFYGDSITEGVRTVNKTAANDTDRNDAAQGWAYTAGQMLGAEVGIVGFGASGFLATGSGSVPPLPSSYNLLYQGVARSFANLDFIVLMEGTNDSGDVTSAATTVLNGLLAANATAKIIVLRPFDGVAGGNGTAHASQLQAAIAACSAPARVTYVNTAGWFTTANSSDSLHPYGIENITHIAPLAVAAIRSALATTTSAQPTQPATTARTFSVTLGNASGAAASRSGLHVNLYDTPNAGTTNATNASGVLSATAQTTLASGATGYASVLDPATGEHWNGPVTVQ